MTDRNAFAASDLGVSLDALTVTIGNMKEDRDPTFPLGLYDEILSVVGEDCYRFGAEGDAVYVANAMRGLLMFAHNPADSLCSRVREVQRCV